MIKHRILQLSSFFRFYYFLLRKDKRVYDITENFSYAFPALITPTIIMIIVLFFGVFISKVVLLFSMLFIPIHASHVIIFMSTRNKAMEIRRKLFDEEQEARRRARKAEHEEWMKEYEKSQREYFENLRRATERIRQEHMRNERARQQKQEEQVVKFKYSSKYMSALKYFGLNDSFTESQLRKAYREKSKIHHPDRGGSSESFINLQNAYEFLSQHLDGRR